MIKFNLEKILLIALMFLCLSGFYMAFKGLDRAEKFSLSTQMFKVEEVNHTAIKSNPEYAITKLETQNESITVLTSLIKNQNDILTATAKFCLVLFVFIFILCFIVLLRREKETNQQP